MQPLNAWPRAVGVDPQAAVRPQGRFVQETCSCKLSISLQFEISSGTPEDCPELLTSLKELKIMSDLSGAAAEPPGSLGHLPVEIIDSIINFLDHEQRPSSRTLRHEPSVAICESEVAPMKCLSGTCHSLRKLIFPKLFQFLVLRIHVRIDNQVDPYRRADVDDVVRFIARHRMLVKSVVAIFTSRTTVFPTEVNKGFAARLCSQIKEQFEPEILTIAIPPSIIPYLAIGGHLIPSQDESWAFDIPLHVLSFSRTPGQPNRAQEHSNLHGACWDSQWTSLTLNEGSSIKAYSSYEYYLKRPPSLFGSRHMQRLLRWNWSNTLHNLEYIAIFPIATHIRQVISALRSLHSLEVLSVQFGPHESSTIMSNFERLGKCDIPDLWMEFRECYVEIFRFIGEMSIASLRAFKSLDWSQYSSQIVNMPEEFIPNWTLDIGYWTKPAKTGEMFMY